VNPGLGNPRLRAGDPGQGRAAAAARARAADVAPYLEAARRAGARTLRELAAALDARGVPAPAGGRAGWRPEQVRRVLAATAGGRGPP
jgi:hypothetical protein